MKIEFNNEEVILGWQHDNQNRQTTCYMRWPNGVALEAVATCSVQDKFVKETGRKVSLARLLKKVESKNERRRIWEQYLNRG